MGTKLNPGKFDCYANAEPNEPIFVLMGRDPIAPILIGLWATLKEYLDGFGPEGRGTDQTNEARKCAREMEQWCQDDESLMRQRLTRFIYADEIRTRHAILAKCGLK